MNTGNVSLRQKWIAYWRSVYAAWDAGHNDHPPFPDELHDMRCGAKTRAGTPCRMKALYRNGRCKLHGGLSTGPKTEAGKARASQNWRGGQPGDEPLVRLRKPEFPEPEGPVQQADITLNSDNETGPIQKQIEARDNADSPQVRCVDCKFLSAGYTCTLGLAGSLSIGSPRRCSKYVDSRLSYW